ncbi:MAG: ZIP family metal transporter [Candidatus Woesearchaeota archaeon]|nr:MAG: ZIP family metal transporter [Candidatus Woesearchaeota archaeon]
MNIWLYSVLSVLIVSIISLIGALLFTIKASKLKKNLVYFVSFSAGALLGDVFIHLLPEAIKESSLNLNISLYIISGIIVSFIVEKIIHWKHSHYPPRVQHHHPFAIMNLFGDALHNFIDGIIIGASYLASIPVGIATTLAVVFHEIPQEIGDFGILLHGGFSKSKALFFNFIISLTSIAGVIIALTLNDYIPNLSAFLIPFAAGGFIYIAGSDLIPEMHRETKLENSIMQILLFILGVIVMFLLTLI